MYKYEIRLSCYNDDNTYLLNIIENYIKLKRYNIGYTYKENHNASYTNHFITIHGITDEYVKMVVNNIMNLLKVVM